MRKKLFAVIMSAMMMITFMPAMAFAATDPGDADAPAAAKVATANRWTVAGFTQEKRADDTFVFTYDAKDHAVTYTPKNVEQKWWEYGYYRGNVVSYSLYTLKDADWGTAVTSATAPVVKNAGSYKITALCTYTDEDGYVFQETSTVYVQVKKRDVKVAGYSQIIKTKDYDGEGFVVTDKDFAITNPVGPDGKALVNSGLVEGDSLFVGTLKTGADAGTYYYYVKDMLNPNYAISQEVGMPVCILTINKANNVVTAPVTHRAAKAGTKFSINAKAKFGDVKVTKVQGSKYLKVSGKKILVKANAKKGSYKIKVKVYSEGNTNYKAASLTKWVYVKVR